MAARGVNGAAAATLNARFIKCEGCRVNVPKEDMLVLGRCTVCGRVYEPEITDGGRSVTVETVAFDAAAAASASAAAATPAAVAVGGKPRRKRWAVLTSKKGRTYYHNTETGEDTWEAPPDLDAEAAEDAFGALAAAGEACLGVWLTMILCVLWLVLCGAVPFKNDAVKNAVLREQAKAEATRMGVPMEVIAQAQRREQEQELANDPIAQLGGRQSASAPAAAASVPKRAVESTKLSPHAEHSEEDDKEEEEGSNSADDQDEDKQRTCAVM